MPVPVPLKLVVSSDGASLKDLDQLKPDLHTTLEDNAMIVASLTATRSLDPLIVGQLTLGLLPVAVDKLVDLVV